MLKKSLPIGLIILSLNTISAQKLTIDLEKNFRYISTTPRITLYLVESNHNQVVLSGSNIDSVMTKVMDDVLTIEVNPADRPYLNHIVVYYEKKYIKSYEMGHASSPEGTLSNTLIKIPRIEKL